MCDSSDHILISTNRLSAIHPIRQSTSNWVGDLTGSAEIGNFILNGLDSKLWANESNFKVNESSHVSFIYCFPFDFVHRDDMCMCFVCFDLDTVVWNYRPFTESIEIIFRSDIWTEHRRYLDTFRMVNVELETTKRCFVMSHSFNGFDDISHCDLFGLVRSDPGLDIHLWWSLLRIHTYLCLSLFVMP